MPERSRSRSRRRSPDKDKEKEKEKDKGKEKEKESSSVPMGEQEDTGAGVFPVDEEVTLPKFKEDVEKEEEHKKVCS